MSDKVSFLYFTGGGGFIYKQSKFFGVFKKSLAVAKIVKDLNELKK